MALLFFKKYIIAAFLIITLIVGLGYYLISRRYRPYHRMVSDTQTPYLELDFVGYHDKLVVYTISKGNDIYLKCMLGSSTSTRVEGVPREYNNPYEYIMSGHLDYNIRALRVDASKKESIKLQQQSVGDVDNVDTKINNDLHHLSKLPIKFKDIGDEIRQRIGVR